MIINAIRFFKGLTILIYSRLNTWIHLVYMNAIAAERWHKFSKTTSSFEDLQSTLDEISRIEKRLDILETKAILDSCRRLKVTFPIHIKKYIDDHMNPMKVAENDRRNTLPHYMIGELKQEILKNKRLQREGFIQWGGWIVAVASLLIALLKN